MTMQILCVIADGLPDPKSYEAIGWLLLAFAALAAAVNQLWALVVRIKGKPERGGNVGRAEVDEKIAVVEEKLDAARKDLQNQITEARTYAHDKIHDLSGDYGTFKGLHEERSQGVQNRINALMELVYHMRGQFDQVLAEQRLGTVAIQRAATATETAVRYLTDQQSLTGAS